MMPNRKTSSTRDDDDNFPGEILLHEYNSLLGLGIFFGDDGRNRLPGDFELDVIRCYAQ